MVAGPASPHPGPMALFGAPETAEPNAMLGFAGCGYEPFGRLPDSARRAPVISPIVAPHRPEPTPPTALGRTASAAESSSFSTPERHAEEMAAQLQVLIEQVAHTANGLPPRTWGGLRRALEQLASTLVLGPPLAAPTVLAPLAVPPVRLLPFWSRHRLRWADQTASHQQTHARTQLLALTLWSKALITACRQNAGAERRNALALLQQSKALCDEALLHKQPKKPAGLHRDLKHQATLLQQALDSMG